MAVPNAVNKRLVVEVDKLQKLATNTDPSSVKFIVDQSPIDAEGRPTNVLAAGSKDVQYIIIGRILPNSDIYRESAFQIEMKLSSMYPFVLPQVRFITPIYHPNVLEQGERGKKITCNHFFLDRRHRGKK
jgi:ubiquitin-protein ligase